MMGRNVTLAGGGACPMVHTVAEGRHRCRWRRGDGAEGPAPLLRGLFLSFNFRKNRDNVHTGLALTSTRSRLWSVNCTRIHTHTQTHTHVVEVKVFKTRLRKQNCGVANSPFSQPKKDGWLLRKRLTRNSVWHELPCWRRHE